MADLKEKLSEEKQTEILTFLTTRFEQLDGLRKSFDDEIKEDIDITNNIDKNEAYKEDYEEKIKIPFIYTIIQTIVARLTQTFFGRQNWLKIYGEEKPAKKIAKEFTRFAQAECDKVKLKDRSRDFFEDSLSERTNWIHIWPVFKGEGEGKKFRVEMGVYSWYDVWFDTIARKVEDSDYFVRKIVKFWRIRKNEKIYFNIDKIKDSSPPDPIKEKQKYEAKHGEDISYYDLAKNNVTDKVELLEYMGWYDISENPDEPDFQPVLFVLANRTILCRIETVELKTKRKILMFPLRPLKQGKSLIGKSIPQLIKDTQYELNETRSLRMQNFKLLVKLLFKRKRDGGVDLDELFAKGGNVINYEDDPNDIQPFDIPNMVGVASAMSADQIQVMQQIVGATDTVMGINPQGDVTAKEVQTVTEQALFKFSQMAENMYGDLMELINFIIILKIKYDRKTVLLAYPSFKEFLDAQTEEDMEDGHLIDIAVRDLSVRRDVARAQFINMANIFLPMLQNVGGNIKEFLRQAMDRMDMENIDEIINPPPETQQQIVQLIQMMQANPQLAQLFQQLVSDPSGKLLKQILLFLQGTAGGTAGGPAGPSGPAGPVQPAQKASRPEEDVGLVPEVRS